jgi:hypothetical protein
MYYRLADKKPPETTVFYIYVKITAFPYKDNKCRPFHTTAIPEKIATAFYLILLSETADKIFFFLCFYVIAVIHYESCNIIMVSVENEHV